MPNLCSSYSHLYPSPHRKKVELVGTKNSDTFHVFKGNELIKKFDILEDTISIKHLLDKSQKEALDKLRVYEDKIEQLNSSAPSYDKLTLSEILKLLWKRLSL